jgi:organic radical activating enzyme
MNKQNGPVDVNGDITPTTRQPIPQINADDWPEMSVSELLDQLSALQQRKSYIISFSGDPVIIRQMEEGLYRLNAIITSKSQPTNTNSRDIGLI